ncbi:(d)CMP kinase [Paracidobacterium acidisoli]|uniref:Cytidylate kinase n=1 Tax=Paracidobacterium acidisoli TaxID=2303751 RepID=A0A372INE6_9BACT|nr:(d)CMP kinase [Paracidobacterium acidisoli]MBT9332157.1 (d)CMP kinase [Paracidobacterium acidisoli]
MTDGRGIIIAIDGPAGAGKSTVARHLARHFGLLNLETGAMYRAFALRAIEGDFDFDDPVSLERLAGQTKITLVPTLTGNRVLLDGIDVTQRIRDSDVTQGASRVSVHPTIRAWMVDLQRALGQKGGIVMEGRDIGTVVFPDADLKFFLDASPEARSQRRYEQTPAAAENRGTISQELRERDERDRNRAQSPLRPAPDAVTIDSTDLSLEEVLRRIESIVKARLSTARPAAEASSPSAP